VDHNIDTATRAAPLSSFPVELVGLGRKRLEAIFDAQSKLVDALPALGREWMSHAQAERELTSDLVAKLTAARTVPESARVYREWLARRLDMFAEETRTLLTDAQTLADVGARLFAVDMADRAATGPAAADVH
jgi:hypothetical protein